VAFVVVAIWKARPGEEGRIQEVLRAMTPLSRQEPGNLQYEAQVSRQDPARFLLYERYVSAQAFEAHRASAHFQEHVVGHALGLLESREVSTWETLDG
jgi:autoinducer 2-degrading protein